MIDLAILLPLFTLGLVSSAHCIGMCGGIMGALTMAIPSNARAQRWIILVAYNVGRILSYTSMGLLAGFFAAQFAAMGGGLILRVLAGILLIVMGLYLADWWRGLTKLETVGRYVWVYIQPLGKNLMPVNSLPKALLLGALWGWLPCGLVYAALATAMTQPSPALAASAMLAFGLGTLPAVLVAGFAAQRLSRFLQKRQVRVGMALAIIVFGLWTIWGSLSPSHGHHDHSTMNHHAEPYTHDHSSSEHLHDHTPDKSTSENMSHSATTLERQRTDEGDKLEDDTSSISSVEESAVSHSHHHGRVDP